MTRQGVWNVRKLFETVGVDQADIDFSSGGVGMGLQSIADEDEGGAGQIAREVLDRDFPLPPDELED